MSGPTAEVRRELERILQEDTSRVGDVYRRLTMDAHEIAADLGVDSANFVSNNRTIIRSLLEGALPGGPAIRGSVASKVRSVRRSRGLSGEAAAYLDRLLVELGEATSGSQPARMPERRSGLRPESLRRQVEEEVRRRTGELVERIHEETELTAQDYRSVVASDRPLDAMVRVIHWRYDEGTYDELQLLGRRDLTLEHAVVAWADDLPLTYDLVDEARARIDSFFDRPRSKDNQ